MADEMLTRPAPRSDHRLRYGTHDQQFGDLFLPDEPSEQSFPVVVFLHGGWWKAEYGLDYGGHLAEALKKEGAAVWSIEYRRVGNGGGYPETFLDVASGFDQLREIASSFRLDLSRVVVLGHSAGGHLAFWLAARPHIPIGSVLHPTQSTIPIRGVLSLAGAVDLRLTIALAGWTDFAHDRQEVANLMGGLPDEVPERYRDGNPGDLLPIGVPQWVLQGANDDQIPPELPESWTERGLKLGERVSLEMIPGADHFDLVDPQSKYWPNVRSMVLTALA